MRSVALTAAVSACAFAFALSPAALAAEKQTDTAKPAGTVTVRQGDNLSDLAKAKKTTFKRMYFANPKIKHPDLIYTGQKLRVPAAAEKLKSRAMPASVAIQPASQVQAPATVGNAAPGYQYAGYSQAQPQRAAAAPVSSAPASGGTWDRLAACESGGNWQTNTGNGYHGGLQFSQSSWEGVGGSGLPSQASKAEQIRRAEMLQSKQGWGAWPACSAKLGL